MSTQLEIYLEKIETLHQQLYWESLKEGIHPVRHQVQVEGKLHAITKQLMLEIHVDIFENQANTLLSQLKVAFTYRIPNEEIFLKTNTVHELKETTAKLLELVSWESVATTRGLMIGYLKDTPLQNAYLPLVLFGKR